MKKKFLIGLVAVFAMVIGLNGIASEEPSPSFFIESDNMAFAETGGGGGGCVCAPRHNYICGYNGTYLYHHKLVCN